MRYKERGASLSPSPWGDPPLIQCAGEGVSSITRLNPHQRPSLRARRGFSWQLPFTLQPVFQAPGAGGQPQKTSLAEVILGHRRSGLMACRACCRKTVESLYQRIVDLMVPPAAGDCGTGSPGNPGRRGSRDIRLPTVKPFSSCVSYNYYHHAAGVWSSSGGALPEPGVCPLPPGGKDGPLCYREV